jgi:hypothetical protein
MLFAIATDCRVIAAEPGHIGSIHEPMSLRARRP